MLKILEKTVDFFLPSGDPGTYGEKMPTAEEVLERKREEMLEAQRSIVIKPPGKQQAD